MSPGECVRSSGVLYIGKFIMQGFVDKIKIWVAGTLFTFNKETLGIVSGKLYATRMGLVTVLNHLGNANLSDKIAGLLLGQGNAVSGHSTAISDRD